jgi:hypothetical protein
VMQSWETSEADVIGAAVKVMRITTGEEPEDYGHKPESDGKNPAAVALGRIAARARLAGHLQHRETADLRELLEKL